MLILLPFLSFIIAVLTSKSSKSWRDSILHSSLLLAVFIIGSTEILSLFEAITQGYLVAIWSIFTVVLLIMLLRKSKFRSSGWGFPAFGISTKDSFILLSIIIIFILIATTAILVLPNTPDAQAYHMSRVCYWEQHHSVSHFSTNDTDYLYLNPLNEFVILQLRLLTCSDLFANMVQCVFFGGCVLGVSVLSRDMGASRSVQLFSSVLCITIPMAIMQGTSAKNDLMLSFWLLLLAILVFRIAREKQVSTSNILWSGVTLGCCVLSKSTAYVYALPFVLFLCVSLFRRKNTRTIGLFLLTLLIAFCLNSGHYIRNYSVFSSPMGPSKPIDFPEVKNEVYGIRPLVSNMVRNAAIHITTPFTCQDYLLLGLVNFPHKIMKQDVNDPRTSFQSRFELYPTRLDEDHDGNFIHFVLTIIALIMIITCYVRNRKDKDKLVLAWMIISGFCLFCVVIKWQTFHSRLHTPLFVLAAPLVATVLFNNRQRLRFTISLLLILMCLPWVLGNSARPMVGSNSIFKKDRLAFFFQKTDYTSAFKQAADIIKNGQYRDIGICSQGRAYEYPLWVALGICGSKDERYRIGHVFLDDDNSSLKCKTPGTMKGFKPEVIIFCGDPEKKFDNQTIPEKLEKIESINSLHIYVPTKA